MMMIKEKKESAKMILFQFCICSKKNKTKRKILVYNYPSNGCEQKKI